MKLTIQTYSYINNLCMIVFNFFVHFCISGPCPGTDQFTCVPNVNYPDRHSCTWHHVCRGPTGSMLAIPCADRTVFDIESSLCITPGSDFNCFPRCPGVTFPETSNAAWTTPLDTTIKDPDNGPTTKDLGWTMTDNSAPAVEPTNPGMDPTQHTPDGTHNNYFQIH